MRLRNLFAELKRRNRMSCRLTSFRLSCMCEHYRHRTASSDAHNVNAASTVAARVIAKKCRCTKARCRYDFSDIRNDSETSLATWQVESQGA